jgi:hypothetical protein
MTRLHQIVTFSGVAPGGVVTLPHDINVHGVPFVPDRVFRDNCAFSVMAMTTTSVTVQNTTGGVQSLNLWLEYLYSSDRVFELPGPTLDDFGSGHLTPNPFVAGCGVNGGGAANIDATRLIHIPVGEAATLVHGAGAFTPDVVFKGNLVYLEFNHPNDTGFRVFKIDTDFKDSASLHVHWTKSQDQSEDGNTARFRIDYRIFESTQVTPGNAAVTGAFIDTRDMAYDIADAPADRYVFRSADMPIIGATAGYYLALKITALTPLTGTPVSNPGLVSIDLMYNAYINQ